jgi:hypothetical protein
MKRVVLVCLLIAAPVLAKRFVRLVADDWRIEGTTLRFTPRAAVGSANAEPAQALAIDEAALARALEIEPEAVAGYLKGLDPKLPILIEPGFYKTRSVVGIRQLTEERLRSDLRLELSPTLEARLVNAGKWTHRVVKPGDGSESGWREPEVYLEREVDGKWVRGAKPGRCGLYAHDWQKDVIDLKLGDALPIGGFVEPRMAFGLSAPAKAKVRLVYVYRGGRASKGREVEPEPGPMAKTPPFAIFSEPVEIRIE